jgi:hypothetical protein
MKKAVSFVNASVVFSMCFFVGLKKGGAPKRYKFIGL